MPWDLKIFLDHKKSGISKTQVSQVYKSSQCWQYWQCWQCWQCWHCWQCWQWWSSQKPNINNRDHLHFPNHPLQWWEKGAIPSPQRVVSKNTSRFTTLKVLNTANGKINVPLLMMREWAVLKYPRLWVWNDPYFFSATLMYTIGPVYALCYSGTNFGVSSFW